jgi:hypothetical protein
VNPPAGSKFPISEIRNLVDIHHGKLIRYSGTSDPADASFPSALTITHAAFYTHSMHDNFFQLKENLTGNVTAPDELGYVIGGTILKPAAGHDGDVTLTSTKGSFDVPQPRTMLLKGVEGEEVVYDIIFDNHCKPRDAALCDKEVTNHGGPDGTDFFYYYKVLEEIEHPGREFDLVNFRQPDIFTTGGSGEVAACNPILVDPAP